MIKTNTTLPAVNDTIRFTARTALKVIMVEPVGPGLKALTKGRVTHVVGFEGPNGQAWLGDYDINGTLDRGTRA